MRLAQTLLAIVMLGKASFLPSREGTSQIAIELCRSSLACSANVADVETELVRVRHVFLTHFYADFIAGHLELRDRCGATIHLGARAEAEYAFVRMADGDTLEFQGMRVQVLETPGHTIESISMLVFDLKKDSAKPHAVLTGDTLFIGDVGRPDLRALLGWTANNLGSLFTTHCTTSCCRCRMKRWSTRPTAQDLFAVRSFLPTRFPRLETNGA